MSSKKKRKTENPPSTSKSSSIISSENEENAQDPSEMVKKAEVFISEFVYPLTDSDNGNSKEKEMLDGFASDEILLLFDKIINNEIKEVNKLTQRIAFLVRSCRALTDNLYQAYALKVLSPDSKDSFISKELNYFYFIFLMESSIDDEQKAYITELTDLLITLASQTKTRAIITNFLSQIQFVLRVKWILKNKNRTSSTKMQSFILQWNYLLECLDDLTVELNGSRYIARSKYDIERIIIQRIGKMQNTLFKESVKGKNQNSSIYSEDSIIMCGCSKIANDKSFFQNGLSKLSLADIENICMKLSLIKQDTKSILSEDIKDESLWKDLLIDLIVDYHSFGERNVESIASKYTPSSLNPLMQQNAYLPQEHMLNNSLTFEHLLICGLSNNMRRFKELFNNELSSKSKSQRIPFHSMKLLRVIPATVEMIDPYPYVVAEMKIQLSALSNKDVAKEIATGNMLYLVRKPTKNSSELFWRSCEVEESPVEADSGMSLLIQVRLDGKQYNEDAKDIESIGVGRFYSFDEIIKIPESDSVLDSSRFINDVIQHHIGMQIPEWIQAPLLQLDQSSYDITKSLDKIDALEINKVKQIHFSGNKYDSISQLCELLKNYLNKNEKTVIAAPYHVIINLFNHCTKEYKSEATPHSFTIAGAGEWSVKSNAEKAIKSLHSLLSKVTKIASSIDVYPTNENRYTCEEAKIFSAYEVVPRMENWKANIDSKGIKSPFHDYFESNAKNEPDNQSYGFQHKYFTDLLSQIEHYSPFETLSRVGTRNEYYLSRFAQLIGITPRDLRVARIMLNEPSLKIDNLVIIHDNNSQVELHRVHESLYLSVLPHPESLKRFLTISVGSKQTAMMGEHGDIQEGVKMEIQEEDNEE